MPSVLVVDDDEGMLETCRVFLPQSGYRVETAATGKSALAVLAGGLPAAILLDLRLPDMTGYDVLRWMRSRELSAPIAIVTGFRDAFDPEDALSLGARIYADKPLFLPQLLELVRSLTSNPPLRPAPSPVLGLTPIAAVEQGILSQLHEAVIAGEPGALDELASRVLRDVPPRLRRRFPLASADIVTDAVEDAILEYAANPSRFDPSRGVDLRHFLHLAARRNLANLWRAEAARRARETRYARDQPRVSCPSVGEAAADPRIDIRRRMLAAAVGEPERRAVLVWLAGERSTENIAAALGLSELLPEARKREAKRFKDRILKRLARQFTRGE